jgi:CubicO group peptidase (beta-lactamase class C family)
MKTMQRRFVLRKPLRLLLSVPVFITLIFFCSVKLAIVEKPRQDYSGLDSFINAKMKEHRVPGLSMVILNDQRTVYHREYGVKSAETAEPVDADTIFQAASFSKTLTAYAAMILVEKGKLALDVPLSHYLKKPYLPDPDDANQITLRMILNHTSGLSNDSDGNDRQVYFNPGSQFSYSGAGFRYLQQVMEDVTGIPFAKFMKQTIFNPLAMDSSSFRFKEELLPLMASGHEAGVAFPISPKAVNAAYSLLTTPTDMANFMKEVLRPTLLKPETVAQMLQPTVKWRENIYWGLGFGILKSPNEDFLWHWGNNYYYCNLLIAGKESKQGIVIMTNGNTGMRLAERLAIKVINTYFPKPDHGLDPETFDFIQ